MEVVEGGRNEKHNTDAIGRGADGSLGHTQPLIKSVGGAESSQEDSIRVDV